MCVFSVSKYAKTLNRSWFITTLRFNQLSWRKLFENAFRVGQFRSITNGSLSTTVATPVDRCSILTRKSLHIKIPSVEAFKGAFSTIITAGASVQRDSEQFNCI